ncbi:uncharacterized protein LOC119075671 [Bradysia coprophila]|uniref:uncharacterized protein LOC119075671 n=1 Tax=Bradysia coprophila TaxID=38358 RepID=UPI00187D9C61|nr:uncharacterized protein LOC119075671 [Bradysia coprophila]
MERNGKRKPTMNEQCESNWTESDGLRLQELFDNGLLSLADPISKIISLDKRFAKFNSRVLGSRLGRLRKNNASTSSVNGASRKDEVINLRASSETSDSDECSLICDNMPFLCFTYVDTSDEKEKVVILLDLPGGTKSYEWKFNDRGDGIILQVEWSRALYDVSSFSGFTAGDDQKLNAMQEMLSKQDISRKKIPKCRIQVSLGRKVRIDDDSWEATVIKHEGSKILMIEFSEYHEKIFKKLKRGSFADN